MRSDKSAVAEAIENNIRKLLVDRNPINPRYYDRMSELLDEIIAERRRAALSYRAYLEKVTEFVRQIDAGPSSSAYPPTIDTPAKRAFYDNLGCDEATVVAIDRTILASRQDDWRTDRMKTNRIRNRLRDLLGEDDERIETVIKLATKQNGY
jgi:type I restriction enzyme R subunit